MPWAAPFVLGSAGEPTASMLQTVTPALEALATVLPHPGVVQLAAPLQPLAVPLPAMPLPLHAMRAELQATIMSPRMVVEPRRARRGGCGGGVRRVELHRPRGWSREDDACNNQQQ